MFVFQDMSFFKFVEVIGARSVLLDFLQSVALDSQLFCPSQLSCNATEFEVLFIDKRSDPHLCVGPVSVLFIPTESDSGKS